MTDAPTKLLQVDVQCALETGDLEEPPSSESLSHWAQQAYARLATSGEHTKTAEVTIRLVDENEMQTLNRDYRSKDQTTNVLSFPLTLAADVLADMEVNLLGDVIICHPVILQEAQQQNKTADNHYAHMVTHGLLHLCGFDHQETVEAEQMETLETQILAQSGIANPYF